MKIAIIGSREPTIQQCIEIRELCIKLSMIPNAIVKSGCAYGADTRGLRGCFERGMHTIGCLPWATYNEDIHKYCTELQVIDDSMKEAYQSVKDFHPAYSRLSQGAVRLHARNYLIVHDCDIVYAFPSDRPGGGGTGQGIRLVQSLGIEVIVRGPE